MTNLSLQKYLIPTTIVYIGILTLILFNLNYGLSSAAENAITSVEEQVKNNSKALLTAVTLIFSTSICFLFVWLFVEDVRINKMEKNLVKAIDNLYGSGSTLDTSDSHNAITTLYGIREANLKFIVLDEELNIIFITQEFAESFDKVCDELIGCKINSLLSDDNVDKLHSILGIPSCRHDSELTLEVNLSNNKSCELPAHVHKYMFDSKHYLLCSI
jgi:hypothetical protein